MEGVKRAKRTILGMIDDDLQYPVEEIIPMIEKLSEADIVVADRKKFKVSPLRFLFSKTFRFIFGKVFFGLNNDIQSGLKVFTKEVVDAITFTPSSPWTFDLEFLHRAKEGGFIIENHSILFSKRENGDSKIHV